MSLLIELSPEIEDELRRRAEASGQNMASYAARLLRDAVGVPSVDDLLAPFRKQVENSGMSDDELDAFYDGLREKVWEERQFKRANPG